VPESLSGTGSNRQIRQRIVDFISENCIGCGTASRVSI